jgi:lipoprotein NlpI
VKWYFISLGFFILALMSKPMAVSLPVVLLILDWYPFRRLHSGKTVRTALVEKLPFFTFSLISSILTVLAQRAGGALVSIEVIPLSTRLLAAAGSLLIYLWNMILPVNLIPFYQYPRHVSLLTLVGYFLAVVMVIGITVLCVILAKKKKLWLAVWGYYLITLFPVLGVVQVGSQSMADRYTYLPSLGPFAVFGLVLVWLSRKVHSLAKWRPLVVIVGNAMAIIAFVSMTYLTIGQIGIWKNSFVFWNYVITKEPERVPIAYYGLGTFFQQAGLYDRAIENFDRAITLDASLYQVYNNKGVIYGILGQYDKAIECFNKAIAINPNSSAYNNRGLTLYFVGQYSRALEDYNKAIELNQRFVDAYFNRGNVYFRTGRTGLALFDFQKGCDLGDRKSCNSLAALRPMMMPDQKKE